MADLTTKRKPPTWAMVAYFPVLLGFGCWLVHTLPNVASRAVMAVIVMAVVARRAWEFTR